MDFSPQQDKALMAVSNWIKNKNRPPVFRLFGYAGTGKTTLAKHFASNLDGRVFFGAYTGKAAHVLKTKGCPDAGTIHSMIYITRDKGNQKYMELEEQYLQLIHELKNEYPADYDLSKHPQVVHIKDLMKKEQNKVNKPSFSLNKSSDIRGAKLVVIDECSMVDTSMGEDLLSFGVPILVLGDPAQLPPIMGGGFFTNQTPDFMLTEIHRQARDNPILELATKARNNQAILPGQYGTSSVVEKITAQDALSADQILVGRNATRFSSNARMRQLKGITSKYPVEGDKLVCLRNNKEKGLLNGALWKVEEMIDILEEDKRVYMRISPEDGGDQLETDAHSTYFLGNGEKMPWWERKESEEFDYGYALTVHKSQGSQWNKILLIDESQAFKKDAARWLYTAITRAAESIKIMVG